MSNDTPSSQLSGSAAAAGAPDANDGDGSLAPTCVSALILLGGGLSLSPITSLTRCSVLDMLIGATETVFQRWIRRIDTLGNCAAHDLKIIVAAGGSTPPPELKVPHMAYDLELALNMREYRGAAGVVYDVSTGLEDDSLLLVAEAARCPEFNLEAAVQHHLKQDFDATVLVNPDDTPAGIYLLTRRLLKMVQREGYMDLKEQFLQKIMDHKRTVGAFRITDGFSLPLRTREQVLRAARRIANGPNGPEPSLRFASDMRAESPGSFCCVAPNAHIDGTAVVVDSIIMPGAFIGPKSIVTRSIVCANCDISAGSILVDEVRSSKVIDDENQGNNGKSVEART